VGKTTIVRNAVRHLGERAGGFYTEEIRESGARQGFRIVTLDGESAVLAHVDFLAMPHVSKYGVDVAALERVGVRAIERATRECDLVVVDEIGKMELLSDSFRRVIDEAVRAGKPFLGTIMLARDPRADPIKALPQVKVAYLDESNRAQVAQELRTWLQLLLVVD
jgi:nucleoside-triphosphatase